MDAGMAIMSLVVFAVLFGAVPAPEWPTHHTIEVQE